MEDREAMVGPQSITWDDEPCIDASMLPSQSVLLVFVLVYYPHICVSYSSESPNSRRPGLELRYSFL
jgi:hypothetical protein